MNDDDLYEPKLTPPPASAPLVSGTALAVVVVSVALATGCTETHQPGVPVYDAGTHAYDAAPGIDAGSPGLVYDAGIVAPPDASPGVDAGSPGVDAGNPGDSP